MMRSSSKFHANSNVLTILISYRICRFFLGLIDETRQYLDQITRRKRGQQARAGLHEVWREAAVIHAQCALFRAQAFPAWGLRIHAREIQFGRNFIVQTPVGVK